MFDLLADSTFVDEGFDINDHGGPLEIRTQSVMKGLCGIHAIEQGLRESIQMAFLKKMSSLAMVKCG